MAEAKVEDEEFKNWLQQKGVNTDNMTPDQLKAIYTDYQLERDVLQGKRGRAESQAGTALPEGREVGGIYAAANPLEFVGALGHQYKGNEKLDKIEEEEKALAGQSREGRQAYGMALAEQLRSLSTEPTAAPQTPPAGQQPAPTPAGAQAPSPQPPTGGPPPVQAGPPPVQAGPPPARPQGGQPYHNPNLKTIPNVGMGQPNLPPAMLDVGMQKAPPTPQPKVPGSTIPMQGAQLTHGNQMQSVIADMLRRYKEEGMF